MVKKRQQKKNRTKQAKKGAGQPSSQLVNEFRRLRNNTLAKLNRIEKKVNDKARQDAENQLSLNLSKTATNYTDQKEMKKAIQEMKSFTNRYNTRFQYVKNAYGVWGNKKDINFAERQNKLNQRKAMNEIKKLEKHLKRDPNYEARALLLGKESVANVTVPTDFNFGDIKYQSTFHDRLNRISHRAKPQYYDQRKWQMQQNFIDIIHLSFHSDAEELIKDLKSLDPNEFYDLYIANIDMDFEMYDSDGLQDDYGKIDRLRSYIARYKRGEVDLSLKGI